VPWIPPGELFPRPAVTLIEQRDERKRTIAERCERVRELVAHGRPAISWCHYNEEGDYLARCISDSVQVSGRDSLDDKEAKLLDFARGNTRVLVTKGKIGCWGLNLQHCGDMTFFPTFSFEQVYQGIRRCWRFGRKGEVNVEVVSAPGESRVMEGLERKQQKAIEMFAALVRHMNEAISLDSIDRHHKPVQAPAWLNAEEETSCLSSTSV
jgi:hypothetical protein